MQIDLPEAPRPAQVGPPAPQGPTFAQFFRNVEVLRGKAGTVPDQLNCDHLRLVPHPGPQEGRRATDRGRPRRRPRRTPSSRIRATNLTLERAEASGHNVWLFSAAQGVKARCNELIHKKQYPEMPDETYLRGDATTRLVVEKVDVATDGPDKGKVTAFTTIRTIDATIFDDGTGNANARSSPEAPATLKLDPPRTSPSNAPPGGTIPSSSGPKRPRTRPGRRRREQPPRP